MIINQCTIHITCLTLPWNMILHRVIQIEDVYGLYRPWPVHITYPLTLLRNMILIKYGLVMVDINLMHHQSRLHQLRIIFWGTVEECMIWTCLGQYQLNTSSIAITLINDHISRSGGGEYYMYWSCSILTIYIPQSQIIRLRIIFQFKV